MLFFDLQHVWLRIDSCRIWGGIFFLILLQNKTNIYLRFKKCCKYREIIRKFKRKLKKWKMWVYEGGLMSKTEVCRGDKII